MMHIGKPPSLLDMFISVKTSNKQHVNIYQSDQAPAGCQITAFQFHGDCEVSVHKG